MKIATHRYYNQRQRTWGRHRKLEIVITWAVIVLILATLALFLVIYHDVPLRVA